MKSFEELVDKLSELCGIVPEYWDALGEKHVASMDTKKAILKAMGLNIDSVDDVQSNISEIMNRPWNRFIEPVKIFSFDDQPLKVSIYIPIKEREESLSCMCFIENENGQQDEYIFSGDNLIFSDERIIDGVRYIKADMIFYPDRAIVKNIKGEKENGWYLIGYYSIKVKCKNLISEYSGMSRIVIVPDSCYMPNSLINRKTWGVSVNLYSVRSGRNWGIGDFSDLKEIVQWVSELRGGFVGINPLHAIPNKKPFGISPYSPISRLYKNFIYLDIEGIPEVKELIVDSSRLMTYKKQIEEQITELRNCKFIDYERVASLKASVLREAFEIFYREHYLKDSLRYKDFKRYITEEGSSLESFATYMALSNHFTNPSIHQFTHSPENWQQWPEEYRTPSSHTVQEFKKTHEKEILFYKYIQWLIDEQLKEMSELTEKCGMPIGIYHDLAVGSTGNGSDSWTNKAIIADGVSLGAPPDDFNPKGQNWGFPPLIPERLKESGYEFFIQTIRKNMKHFGALRIDHALGLFRQFWIPDGMDAEYGAYVRYPSEDLLGIIALESVRNKTMVVAEDLGTIGEGMRESLLKFGMLSYRLLYFEKEYPDPSFLPPDKYPEMALCAVTTHDLPTVYGWWIGRDIEIKKRLGIYADEDAMARDIKNRQRDKVLLIDAISSLLNNSYSLSEDMSSKLCLAIYEYLARTPCKLLSVSLDDAIGTIDQQNMPGTINEHPNWIQKMSVTLEEIMSDEWFLNLSKMFQKNCR